MLQDDNIFLKMILGLGRKIIPRPVFMLARPAYHWSLSILGAIVYGFPSRSLKVIAVTGTKGKSTVVYMLSKVFESAGIPVAAIGSLGYKIKDKEWPNTLKMTMPGRMRLHKFLSQAKNKGVKYLILEATSEGIAQHRLAGIKIDCAVFTGLHKEHLESHGSFENYVKAKQKLFLKTKNIHIINIDDKYFEKFINISSAKKITFGLRAGDINNNKYSLILKLAGIFNVYNALAVLSVASAYGLETDKTIQTLQNINKVPGRMEFIKTNKPFDVVIDYAHTPDSLELVYKTLKQRLATRSTPGVTSATPGVAGKLICVLGAAGGGRDKWKRPEFGRIASTYCDNIILTNEDPYDEDPEEILNDILKGLPPDKNVESRVRKIIDRKEAIKNALSLAQEKDTIIITGKGSETSMAIGGDKKIAWSDRAVVEELLS